MTEGFLVVDKASGMTSHDVVSAVRRATGVRKVGHAGTLDPMATGVVTVAVGRVTRLLRYVQDLDKEYLTTGVFGVATDTLDADGSVLEREPMEVTADEVVSVARRFVGTIEQIPPMVSALKVGGERLYAIARRGESVEREPRRVVVHAIEVTDFAPGPYPEVSFRVVCSKGTYVRSLVDDIARALGGRAHLVSLRRTRVGSLGLDRSVSVDDLSSYQEHLLPAAEALGHLPRIEVDEEVSAGVGHGLRFVAGPLAEIAKGVPTLVIDGSGRSLAVYRREDREARPEVVLA